MEEKKLELVNKDFFNVVEVVLKGKHHDMLVNSKFKDCLRYAMECERSEEINISHTTLLIDIGRTNRKQRHDAIKSIEKLFKNEFKIPRLKEIKYHEKITMPIPKQ